MEILSTAIVLITRTTAPEDDGYVMYQSGGLVAPGESFDPHLAGGVPRVATVESRDPFLATRTVRAQPI